MNSIILPRLLFNHTIKTKPVLGDIQIYYRIYNIKFSTNLIVTNSFLFYLYRSL